MAERTPIFEIERRNPEASWNEEVDIGQFLSARDLNLFDRLGKRIEILAGDDELKGIQVLDDGGDHLRIRPIIADGYAETDLSCLFKSGLVPDTLVYLNGNPVEAVVVHHNPSEGQIVGVLKFVA